MHVSAPLTERQDDPGRPHRYRPANRLCGGRDGDLQNDGHQVVGAVLRGGRGRPAGPLQPPPALPTPDTGAGGEEDPGPAPAAKTRPGSHRLIVGLPASTVHPVARRADRRVSFIRGGAMRSSCSAQVPPPQPGPSHPTAACASGAKPAERPSTRPSPDALTRLVTRELRRPFLGYQSPCRGIFILQI